MSDEGLSEVKSLVKKMSAQPALTKAEVNRLYEAHKKQRRIDFLAPAHVQQQQVYELEKRLEEESRNPIKQLWQRSISKDAENDLALHASLISEFFSYYLRTGSEPPPASAWRITVILRKQKEHEIDREFLEAWCSHFGDGLDAVYAKLAKRYQKLI